MKASADRDTLRIDFADERLWRGERNVPLAPKAFALLRYLVNHPNRLLTKNEILDNVWPDTYVTEGLVREYVQALRRALGDSPKVPKFIETVHRRGYRYIGQIEILADEVDTPETTSNPASLPVLAVLALENFTGQKRWDRLADGLTDDMITEFTRYRDLLTIARNSTFIYKGKPIDVRQIGRELGADYVLEGSIQADDERIRLNAQLVNTQDGSHLWADRYDRRIEDIFAIQDAIVERVTAAIGGFHGAISRQERKKASNTAPSSLRAYELYLLGYEHEAKLDKENTLEAIKILEQAIKLDPHFARAWIVLGWAYKHIVINKWLEDTAHAALKRREAFEKAVALDADDAISQRELGLLHAEGGDIVRATEFFERALELGRNHADLLALIAIDVATVFGREQEAIALMRRAFRLNPHAPGWYHMQMARVAYFAGEFKNSIAASKQASDFLNTYLFRLLSLAQLQSNDTKRVSKDFHCRYPDFDAYASIRGSGILHPAAIEHYQVGLRKAGLID